MLSVVTGLTYKRTFSEIFRGRGVARRAGSVKDRRRSPKPFGGAPATPGYLNGTARRLSSCVVLPPLSFSSLRPPSCSNLPRRLPASNPPLRYVAGGEDHGRDRSPREGTAAPFRATKDGLRQSKRSEGIHARGSPGRHTIPVGRSIHSVCRALFTVSSSGRLFNSSANPP